VDAAVVVAGRHGGFLSRAHGGRSGGLQLSSDDIEVLLLQDLVGWDEVRETQNGNLLGLWSEPMMTALAGVAPLLGGVTEECSHLPHLLEVVSPG
jgi:hypothetical protein